MLQQRDNAISLKFAQASVDLANRAKDDSRAMKALAIVSTVFLPGSFVSVGHDHEMPGLSGERMDGWQNVGSVFYEQVRLECFTWDQSCEPSHLDLLGVHGADHRCVTAGLFLLHLGSR